MIKEVLKLECNNQGKLTYQEYVDGTWDRWDYENNSRNFTFSDLSGYWCKYEFDEFSNNIYREDSEGLWERHRYDPHTRELLYQENETKIVKEREYNNQRKILFYRDGNYWYKNEYDENGNNTYYENSFGEIRMNGVVVNNGIE